MRKLNHKEQEPYKSLGWILTMAFVEIDRFIKRHNISDFLDLIY